MRNPKWNREELILALELYFDLKPSEIDSKNEKVIALSKVLNKFPSYSNKNDASTFRNPNGVAMKLSNFKRFDPNIPGKGLERGGKLEAEIWQEFYEKKEDLTAIANVIKEVIENDSIDILELVDIKSEEEIEFPEGRLLYKNHKFRERNQKVVVEKKRRALMDGELKCEVCNFDFYKIYGELGKGYIECHHTVPISHYKANDKTTLDNLALVCSNCHRILHRKRPWMSIDDLKKILGKSDES